MIIGRYLPTRCQLVFDDDRTVNTLVLTMDPCHPLLESDTRVQVIMPFIATVSGPSGTNAQYLFPLEQELVKSGIQDDCLNDLVITVKQLLRENPPEGVVRPGLA